MLTLYWTAYNIMIVAEYLLLIPFSLAARKVKKLEALRTFTMAEH